jgi:hypothetical protein
VIRCPHCQAPIFDDGKLAGQYVLCPRCQSAFPMPRQQPQVPSDDSPTNTPTADGLVGVGFVLSTLSVCGWILAVCLMSSYPGAGSWHNPKRKREGHGTSARTRQVTRSADRMGNSPTAIGCWPLHHGLPRKFLATKILRLTTVQPTGLAYYTPKELLT